ncbi:uncharacterized protein LOC126897651 [Daktulosphaira vitifoliae]|uniref:uncharacterized protein LOC126897651 n=1 Tax=Daktulosphaira vitifoliae TaxID=58002 RepID=UPI0021AA06A9|nr:uncharacterized protein LOC126897651 [Daktulosphaira vitifoliae]
MTKPSNIIKFSPMFSKKVRYQILVILIVVTVHTFKICLSMPFESPQAVWKPLGITVQMDKTNDTNWTPMFVLVKTEQALKTVLQQAVKASEEMLRGVGRLFLATGESINFVWDFGISSVLTLCRIGSEAYNQMVQAVEDLPVLGFGARGVDEAIKTSLKVAEYSAKQDMEARKTAYGHLKQKIDSSASSHATIFTS